MISRRLLMLSAVALGIAACKHDPVPTPPTPSGGGGGAGQASPVLQAPVKPDSTEFYRLKRARDDSILQAQNLKVQHDRLFADSVAKVNADRAAAVVTSDAMKATLMSVVRFEYDRFELRDDTKAALDAKIPILNANTGVALRIAGHADDHGSGEYNLQLGQRRAAAVRDYLASRGVAAARMELVSYGEERPVCKEEAEACWSQNRRAEFEITAGGAMLKKP